MQAKENNRGKLRNHAKVFQIITHRVNKYLEIFSRNNNHISFYFTSVRETEPGSGTHTFCQTSTSDILTKNINKFSSFSSCC